MVDKSMSAELKQDQDRFCDVVQEAVDLRARKLQDYGTCYKNFGVLGVAVRMSDKMARIQNILKTGNVNNESFRDSFIDIANYAFMACMVIDEEKSREKTV